MKDPAALRTFHMMTGYEGDEQPPSAVEALAGDHDAAEQVGAPSAAGGCRPRPAESRCGMIDSPCVGNVIAREVIVCSTRLTASVR